MPSATAPILSHRYAPGARVEIRDEEWMVRTVQATATGGHALRVVGVSDLVRGRDAMFLDDLDDVTVLDPRETALVHDPSPGYRKTSLYLESLLRQSPQTTAELAVGHRGAMNPAPYQLVPAAKALAQPRARILIADGVGLGKTIEVGILLSELIRRGRGRRILVVALRSVLEQFQQELWARFTIPLVRLDSTGIARVQQRIPANMNPFHFYDRVIISIDTLKKDEKYRRYLEDCQWDAIVIDECQHVAERSSSGGQVSMRARLARLLAATCDSLVLTSATPHDGRPESFASLMNLLDPTAVADPSQFTHEEIGGLYVRRFKKDVEHEVGESFQERQLVPCYVETTKAEEALLAALAEADFRTVGRVGKGKSAGKTAGKTKSVGSGALFRTLLRKAALSSASALASTVAERAKHPRLRDPSRGSQSPEAVHDRALLERLAKLAKAAEGTPDEPPSKLDQLVELLLGFEVAEPDRDERVVIFSERIDTLELLHRALPTALGLPKEAFGVFTGSLDDTEQQTMVKRFGTRDGGLRVLLCSDAAAEGINLHYYCHRLVHYDIPWSLITLEQRNGRIDRYGQTQRPEIHYLLTMPERSDLQGDLRVLERLIEKEHAAHENLGDVRSLLQLQDAEAEEQHVLEGIAGGLAPEEIIPEVEDGLDFLAQLAAAQAEGEAARAEVATAPSSTLYPDDLQLALEGLTELSEHYDDIEAPRRHEEARGIEVVAPDDLMRRFELLPPELRPHKEERFKLTVDRGLVMKELQRARERSDEWPRWHLLWSLHPIVEWLSDRLVAHMARHAAPVIRVPRGLGEGQACFLVQGVISNRRSQPTICRWFGVTLPLGATGVRQATVQELPELMAALGLGQALANDGAVLDETMLLPLRGLAIDAADAHMQRVRDERATEIKPKVLAETRRLKKWADGRLDQLDAQLAKEKRAAHRARLEQEVQRVEAERDDRTTWYGDALATDSRPYLRLAAVLVPRGHAAKKATKGA